MVQVWLDGQECHVDPAWSPADFAIAGLPSWNCRGQACLPQQMDSFCEGPGISSCCLSDKAGEPSSGEVPQSPLAEKPGVCHQLCFPVGVARCLLLWQLMLMLSFLHLSLTGSCGIQLPRPTKAGGTSPFYQINGSVCQSP